MALACLGSGALYWEHPPVAVSMGVLGIALLLAGRLGLRHAVRRQLRSMAEDTRDIEYQFSEDLLEIRTAISQSQHRYEALVKYAVGKHSLLVYVTPYVAQIIPKRAFREEELAQVERWLRARVKPVPKRVNPYLRFLVLWALLIVASLTLWQLMSPG